MHSSGHWYQSAAPFYHNGARHSSTSPLERHYDSASVSGKSSGTTTPLSTPSSQHKSARQDWRKDSAWNGNGVDRKRSASPSPAYRSTPSPRWRSTKVSEPVAIAPGIILRLPSDFVVGFQSQSTLIRGQGWVNKRATGHPVLVWDTYEKEGELIARCLPMTSFGGTSVEDKYNNGRNTWRYHPQYIPICQGGVPVRPLANQPSLRLEESGASMQKQTYVHLDHFFDIEAKYLSLAAPVLSLTSAALNVVTWKFKQFCRGEIWRKKPIGRKGEIVSPLDIEGHGAPTFGIAAEERAKAGEEIEKKRYELEGLCEWTGHEACGPQ